MSKKTRLVRITASYNQPLDAYYRVPITMDDDDVMQYCRDHSGSTVAIGEFIEDINCCEWNWGYCDVVDEVPKDRSVHNLEDVE